MNVVSNIILKFFAASISFTHCHPCSEVDSGSNSGSNPPPERDLRGGFLIDEATLCLSQGIYEERT